MNNCNEIKNIKTRFSGITFAINIMGQRGVYCVLFKDGLRIF